MTLLDTGFLIDLMRGDEQAINCLQELLEANDPVAVSAITVMELHHGIPRSNDPKKESKHIENGLRGVTTYSITHEVAAKAGRIDGTLTDQGEPIGVPDSLIAATALDHGEPILTRNVKHFTRVTGLDVLNY